MLRGQRGFGRHVRAYLRQTPRWRIALDVAAGVLMAACFLVVVFGAQPV